MGTSYNQLTWWQKKELKRRVSKTLKNQKLILKPYFETYQYQITESVRRAYYEELGLISIKPTK